MKFKFILTSLFLTLFNSLIYSQETTRSLYSLTIIKSVNSGNSRTDKFIVVDSLGDIYQGQKKTANSVNINTFSKEISKYAVEEKLHKYRGDINNIITKFPTPKLNEQTILISIVFLDDFNKEKNLGNKTYYIWGKPFSKDNNDYPLFKYLSEMEILILQGFLE